MRIGVYVSGTETVVCVDVANPRLWVVVLMKVMCMRGR
jgi:hypothetical protein